MLSCERRWWGEGKRPEWLLAGLALLLLGVGLGLRDPWPADEPRFALVAKTMWESGDFLFPRRGAELYADKPPVYFWIQNAAYGLTGSWRVAFLLPSLLGGLLTLALVYDLTHRLYGRRAALYATWALLFTVQFTVQMREARIDAVLLPMMTLSLYGFARHLLLGPAWGWYALAAGMAGLATVTKGVGAIALLALLAYALARRWAPRRLPVLAPTGWRWAWAVPAFLLGVGIWLVPMLTAVLLSPTPEHLAYAREILLGQTAGRYFAAEHHHEPPWYFVRVIATEWLPTSLLLFYALPVWWRRRHRDDGRLTWLLGYFALILAFFTLSSGKRGVYILPALPVLVVALAPLLPGLLRRSAVRYAGYGLALLLASALLLGGMLAEFQRPEWAQRIETYRDLDPWWLPITIGALGLGICLWARPARGHLAILGTLAVAWILYGTWGYHLLDAPRSARGLMQEVGARIGPEAELGLLNWKEQNLLQADRPAVTFGFLRPRAEQELEAVAWLRARPERRVLLVQPVNLEACFYPERARLVGKSNRRAFYLVDASALRESCLPHPPEAWEQRSVADF